MSRKRFTEEQIITLLKRHEQGTKVSDLSREINILEGTFYKQILKYSGMDISDAKRLRALEDKNRGFKHLVADLTLDNQTLKALDLKNFLSPK